MLSLYVLSVVVVLPVAADNLPVFPSTQHVTGIVELPYAELTEPFEFWKTEKAKGSSRLDWYDGLDTVIDRPDLGKLRLLELGQKFFSIVTVHSCHYESKEPKKSFRNVTDFHTFPHRDPLKENRTATKSVG